MPQTDEMGMFENIGMTLGGFSEISWSVRQTLEDCDTFECAYETLRDKEVSALAYVIISGTREDEGVVISRGRFSTVHEEHLNKTEKKWFLIQTNNDHWKTGCFSRCQAATDRMNELKQLNTNEGTLETLMMRYPTMNEITVYHTSMVASRGVFRSSGTAYTGDIDGSSGYDNDLPLGTVRMIKDHYTDLLEHFDTINLFERVKSYYLFNQMMFLTMFEFLKVNFFKVGSE